MFPVLAASHKKTPSYGRMRSCGIPGTLRFLAFFTVVASIQISPHIFVLPSGASPITARGNRGDCYPAGPAGVGDSAGAVANYSENNRGGMTGPQS